MQTDIQFADEMSSLQFMGYGVKWYAHRVNHFSKRLGFYSRRIAEIYAREHGLVVTPSFTEQR